MAPSAENSAHVFEFVDPAKVGLVSCGSFCGGRPDFVGGRFGLAGGALLIKNPLRQTICGRLEGSVAMGQINFQPWTLEVTTNDLVIAGQDGASRQFQFTPICVNAKSKSLFQQAPVVKTLRLEGPQLALTRPCAGRYDLDNVLARLAERGPQAAWRCKSAKRGWVVGAAACRPVQTGRNTGLGHAGNQDRLDQTDQWRAAVFRPFRQIPLLGKPERTNRQTDRLLARGASGPA